VTSAAIGADGRLQAPRCCGTEREPRADICHMHVERGQLRRRCRRCRQRRWRAVREHVAQRAR
jgi:hypothetical protein